MHVCDGQTDRRTDGQTDRILLAIPRLHYMQRGKKYYYSRYLPNQLYMWQTATLTIYL